MRSILNLLLAASVLVALVVLPAMAGSKPASQKCPGCGTEEAAVLMDDFACPDCGNCWSEPGELDPNSLPGRKNCPGCGIEVAPYGGHCLDCGTEWGY